MNKKELEAMIATDKEMALGLMTEKHCSQLIERGVLSDDDASWQQDIHEELRIMSAEFA